MSDVAVQELNKPKAPPLPVLPPTNDRFSITESGYAYAEVDVRLPVGHTLEDALRPEYWVHHASKLKARAFTAEPDRAGAKIRLRTDDHAWYCECYVRAVDDGGLRLQVILGPVRLGPAEAKQHKGYEKRWNVGARGYDILRLSDNQIVANASKIKTREDADNWIAEAQKAA